MSSETVKSDQALPAGRQHPFYCGWLSPGGLCDSIFPVAICVSLAVVTFMVYWPVVGYEFITYDDPEYFADNYHVQAGLTWHSVKWAFSTVYFGNWLPLTWLSHMLDGQLFGTGPAEPHCVNLLLHATNGVLVFLLLRQLTGAHWRSAFVAALFALHPLRVESVAWVAERRDVLSAFFGLLSLIFYARYAQQQSSVERQESKFRLLPALDSQPSTLNYLLTLFFFTCGLMTKAMVVTLPFVMLLLDGWPLKRVSSFKFQVSSSGVSRPSFALHPSHFSLLCEKIPFFVLSVVLSIVTFFAQQKSGAVPSFERLPFSDRVGNALVSYARYVGKTFWPVNLALPYPHPGHWPVGFVAVAGAFVAILSVLAVGLRRKYPFVMTGWFWFLGMLIPVIGLIQTGPQAMADRFTYLPLVGLFIIMAWGVGELANCGWSSRCRHILFGVGPCVLIVLYAVRTRDQLGYWQNDETLFRHTLKVTGENPVTYSCLATYFAKEGCAAEAMKYCRKALKLNPESYVDLGNIATALAGQKCYDEAIQYYEKALQLEPNQTTLRANFGGTLIDMGRTEEGIAQFRRVLHIDPDDPNAHFNLGRALAVQNRNDEAVVEYTAALRFAPQKAEVHDGLGLLLAKQGRVVEAVEHYEVALRAAPNCVEARHNLGAALIQMGRLDEANKELREVLRVKPDYAPAHDNLGVALAMRGQTAEAIVELREALRYAPTNANTHFNLGNALALRQDLAGAVEEYRQTLRLSPGHAQARFNLGNALADMGRREEAIEQLREVLRLRPDYPGAKEKLKALGEVE